MYQKKIIQFTNLADYIKTHPKKRVLVGGCFDVLHIGHIRYLEAAKKEGGVVCVALESDMFIEKKKNRQPFHIQVERAEILSHLVCVDEVIILPYFENDRDYEQLVRLVSPSVIAVTEHDSFFTTKEKHARLVGARVVEVVPIVPESSSRDLIAAIKKLA